VARDGLELAHFDLYRLADPDETAELGLDEALDAGHLVEWPERLGDRCPPHRLCITLAPEAGQGDADSTPRLVTVEGHGSWTLRMNGLDHDG
jgi:tRNA A37 threonylcarbamoyladenosine biosynthesis protein TsaE